MLKAKVHQGKVPRTIEVTRQAPKVRRRRSGKTQWTIYIMEQAKHILLRQYNNDS
jgi:hypothetical protein